MAIESGNPLVDTVLTQKYLEAKEKGVHMMFLLEDAAALPVSDAEFITVLTNLLDNAARAAAECARGERSAGQVQAPCRRRMSAFCAQYVKPGHH